MLYIIFFIEQGNTTKYIQKWRIYNIYTLYYHNKSNRFKIFRKLCQTMSERWNR